MWIRSPDIFIKGEKKTTAFFLLYCWVVIYQYQQTLVLKLLHKIYKSCQVCFYSLTSVTYSPGYSAPVRNLYLKQTHKNKKSTIAPLMGITPTFAGSKICMNSLGSNVGCATGELSCDHLFRQHPLVYDSLSLHHNLPRKNRTAYRNGSSGRLKCIDVIPITKQWISFKLIALTKYKSWLCNYGGNYRS